MSVLTKGAEKRYYLPANEAEPGLSSFFPTAGWCSPSIPSTSREKICHRWAKQRDREVLSLIQDALQAKDRNNFGA